MLLISIRLFKTGEGEDSPVSLRLLLPRIDRRSFGLGRKTFGRLICSLLGISPKNSDDAIGLTSGEGMRGDYCEFAAGVVFRRHPKTIGELPIDTVNTFLDNLSEKPNNSLSDILKWPLNSIGLKWLFRIILKEIDSAIGLSDSSIIRCVSDDLEKCLKSNYSLKEAICVSGGVHLFTPIKSMLSQRLNDPESLSGHESYIVQLKLDGERVQIHYEQSKMMYISRGGFDFTCRYAEMSETIIKSFETSLKNCILNR